MPPPNHQCWECRRRRLVCDAASPVCSKCRSSGIVCPGYGDNKPLTWLAPGRVISRGRRRRHIPALTSDFKNGAAAIDDSSKDQLLVSFANTKAVVARPGMELRTATCDIVEALCYYNSAVYPDYTSNQLEPSPFIIQCPLPVISLVPTAIVHTLVSVALSHRLFTLSGNNTACSPSSGPASKTWSRLYHHRDLAIRALNDLVADEKTRTADITIGSVYTFLYAVLQQSITPNWRQHVDGFVKLVELRGGFESIIHTSPHMHMPLLGFWIVGVLANTTSPPTNQIQACSHPGTAAIALSLYDQLYYPTIPCPSSLLRDILAINNLRSLAASVPDGPPDMNSDRRVLTTTSYEEEGLQILARIEAFVPETWARARNSPHADEWILVGRIFQAAAALYCIMSLQALQIFTSAYYDVDTARALHAHDLHVLLRKAMAILRVRRCMMWPLVVLGVEVARADASVRAFVGQELARSSREQGASLPFVARAVLERFWASGREGWDECFDSPQALVL
ncbi:fungal-specific transcription factor domain-containing protein [Podospora appendiculata]|uniref:Fungal-specific transcription factor domain-containing protein n=1 Tax=Podospora appendiculata TaxID=314037 RepID=A0AAE0XGX0_9PEZI|nr:fungal-specific transcription factor domain-containing protein [Podospora appendiculata]